MVHKIPNADILIHAGDFTRRGTLKEIDGFSEFLDSLNVKHKIVIAGNHDVLFDSRFESHKNDSLKAKTHLKNCYYLEDSGIELYGYKFYGSPWYFIAFN
jgi:3',5'-cyclic AMP phosphodiesterase CpdA